MSETKFTKGEWRFYVSPQPNGCPIVGNSDGLMIAQLAHSVNHKDQEEVAIANAHLITAAKQMYEALDALLGYFRSGNEIAVDRAVIQTKSAEVQNAIAAIKAARGEQ
jgi:hypothetical protein